jgi:folate-binding protein YgfZ
MPRVIAEQSPTPADVVAAYRAASHGFLGVRHDVPGALRIQGRNALDFLHRMSTNALLDLEPGQVRGTVLTTAIGRTVDVVQVLLGETSTLLLTSPGKAAAVNGWLSRYIFFNDDVRLTGAPEFAACWSVLGPQAPEEVVRFGLSLPAANKRFAEEQDAIVRFVARPVPGLQLLLGAETAGRAEARWGNGEAAARAAFEALRIEQGDPAPDREIDDQVIPLEVGLWDLVSFDKGCYIGQEVIARMESRQRIARGLVGVLLDGPAEPPQEVLADRQPVGRMTSAALSPRLGRIGLALVRAAAQESQGLRVTLSPAGTAGTLCPLPFDLDAT